MIAAAAFPLGLLVGSFLNVCIHRLPKDESVVRPRSRCPHCGHAIRWHDNIPVLSFLLLGGRCRDCRGAISLVYPLVELATAVLFVAVVLRFGAGWSAVKYAAFVSMMLALAVADLAERILPDEITLGGTAAGLLFSLIAPLERGAADLLLSLPGWSLPPRIVSATEAALAAAVSAGLLYAVGEIYYRVRFREGMGLGDVKMMALIGAFLGLRQAFLAVMAASVLGAVLGIVFILFFRKTMTYQLPFGTFLAAASILVVVL